MAGVYAYVCIECEHLATDHRSRGGSFVCFCGCVFADKTRTLNRLQFDRWMTKARRQERIKGGAV